MDLLSSLLEDATISQYLRQFPEDQWVEVIKKTLAYGIQSLNALDLSGINVKPTSFSKAGPLKDESPIKQCRHSVRKKKRRKSCFNLQVKRLKKTAELAQPSVNRSQITRGSSQIHYPAEFPAPMKAFYQQEFKFLLPDASPSCFSASLAN